MPNASDAIRALQNAAKEYAERERAFRQNAIAFVYFMKRKNHTRRWNRWQVKRR